MAGKWIAIITKRNLAQSVVQGISVSTDKESHFNHKLASVYSVSLYGNNFLKGP